MKIKIFAWGLLVIGAISIIAPFVGQGYHDDPIFGDPRLGVQNHRDDGDSLTRFTVYPDNPLRLPLQVDCYWNEVYHEYGKVMRGEYTKTFSFLPFGWTFFIGGIILFIVGIVCMVFLRDKRMNISMNVKDAKD